MMSAIAAGLRRPLRAAVWKAVEWLAERRTFLSVRVFALDDAGASAVCFDKVERALRLMATHDSMRLRQVQHVLNGIALTGMAGIYRGSHVPALRLCLLESMYVSNAGTSAEEVAAILVHETTHQRLWDAGIRYGPSVRARVEQICTSAEIGFLRRLPGAADLVRASFQRYAWPASTWTAEAEEKRLAALFEGKDVSGWTAKLSRWLFIEE